MFRRSASAIIGPGSRSWISIMAPLETDVVLKTSFGLCDLSNLLSWGSILRWVAGRVGVSARLSTLRQAL